MISEKMYELGSRRSAIRELFEYGKSAAERVGADNVFDFSLGNPSLPPPREVTETAMRLLESLPPCELHGYTSAQGLPETRQAVADCLIRRYGASIRPDRIYMTCGAAASLAILFRALISSPDDEILAVAPYFPEYKVFAEGAGARFRVLPPDLVGFGIDLDALETAITPRTRALILNSPNNPSGAVLKRPTLTALAALLKRKSEALGSPILLVSDEPYREIVYGEATPYLPALYPDTVLCYSYSKSLSLPGERIGYIAVPDGVREGDRLYAAVCGAGRALGYVCAPALMQRIVAACVDLLPDIRPYRENRDLLYGALTRYGYECVLPEGAFYLFVKAPDGDSEGFCEKAKRENVLIVPGDGFGCAGYLRISYCVGRERIERSLTAFERLIRG